MFPFLPQHSRFFLSHFDISYWEIYLISCLNCQQITEHTYFGSSYSAIQYSACILKSCTLHDTFVDKLQIEMQQYELLNTNFMSQIMLVDSYKGQKVQDVKKPIQKMMVERVRHFYLRFKFCFYSGLSLAFICTYLRWVSRLFVDFIIIYQVLIFSSVTGRGHDLHGARETGHVSFR